MLQEAEKDLPNVDNPNAILVISSFVPAPNDPSDGYWEVYTKYGKLGEASVNLPLSGKAEDRNVFKSPITMLKPGAVFKLRAGAEMLDYYGIKDLNSFKKDGKGIVRKEKEYVHPALALVIAYRL